MGKDIGKLKSRITIQQLVKTPDDQGGYEASWTDLATLWANVDVAKINERVFAQKLEATYTHKITIRRRTDVLPEMRVLYQGRVFQIKNVIKESEENFFVILYCEEGVAS